MMLLTLVLSIGSAAALAAQDPGCDIPVEWRGNAVDVDGTRWPWTLDLVQSGTSLTGVFVWKGSNGHGGEEQVRGTVNCTARVIVLDGVAVDSATIGTAHYDLSLSESFDRVDGGWTGPGPAGTMRGRRRR